MNQPKYGIVITFEHWVEDVEYQLNKFEKAFNKKFQNVERIGRNLFISKDATPVTIVVFIQKLKNDWLDINKVETLKMLRITNNEDLLYL